MMKAIKLFMFLAGICLFPSGDVSAQYQLPLIIFAGGAGTTTSDTYRLNVTVGQSITGKTASNTYQMTLGYVSTESIITSVDRHIYQSPGEFQLFQNYPNPFNPSTTITYQLPKKSYVTLKVFDVLGREIATLVDRIEEPGHNSVTFNAGTLASGMYFYRLVAKAIPSGQAGNHIETKKLILLR